MKIAGLFGKVRGGGWVTLATPEIPLVKQKAFLKELKQENGRGVMVENKRVDLEEAVMFVLGSGKWVGFKAPAKSASASNANLAGSLDQLAEALGIEREALDVLRKFEGFPIKEKQGYNIEAVKAFIAAMPQ
jgi:hypothetical protein